MAYKYPRYLWRKIKQQGRRHPQCRSCKKIPADGEKYFEVTIQQNIFRGDDEMTYYCMACGSRIKASQPA